MSYITDTGPSNRKLTALGIAVFVHILIIYALVTGLASDAYKKLAQVTQVVEIKQEKPPEEPPPPPPEKLQDIPVVTPPPDVVVQQTVNTPPPITTTTTVAVVPTQPVYQAPPSPPAPPPAPPPKKPEAPAQASRARGNQQDWITPDDIPDSLKRESDKSGVIGRNGLSFVVNTQGRVEDCQVITPSGKSELDDRVCSLFTRRARFYPAKSAGGAPVAETRKLTITWQLAE